MVCRYVPGVNESPATSQSCYPANGLSVAEKLVGDELRSMPSPPPMSWAAASCCSHVGRAPKAESIPETQGNVGLRQHTRPARSRGQRGVVKMVWVQAMIWLMWLGSRPDRHPKESHPADGTAKAARDPNHMRCRGFLADRYWSAIGSMGEG